MFELPGWCKYIMREKWQVTRAASQDINHRFEVESQKLKFSRFRADGKSIPRLFTAYRLVFFSCALYLVSCDVLLANNLSVSNVSVASRDASADTATIQFDISWSNSFRNQDNWDAAWVFMKYSTDGGTTWNHATLKTSGTTPTGFSAGSGTSIAISVPTDKYGGFVYRSAAGSGSLSTTAVKFVWDYGTSGVSDTASVVIKVFGIEMVYIPTASFYAGDAETANLEMHFESGATGAALQITSEASLTLGGSGAGSLGNNNGGAGAVADDFNDSTPQTLPAAFPKGYAAFYLMKYEITQGQYTDFLNSLTRLQQNKRVGADVTGDAPAGGAVWVMSNQTYEDYRNTIKCPASGNGTTSPIVFSTTRSDRPCNFLSWMDVAAFLDWAALRPMTELEFEKAAHGPLTPAKGGYAWNTTSITAAAVISGTENGTETITTSGANCCYNSTSLSGGDAGNYGPVRAGIFATASSTRASSGAGYYGNMELTGSVYDMCVCVGSTTGRSFTGTHGDGVLTTTASYEGNATNTDWPGIDGTPARGVTSGTGGGARSGSWGESASHCRICDRHYANYNYDVRTGFEGGRAARTAP